MQKELPKHYHNVNFLNIFQTQTFSKQLLFAILGLLAMVFISKIDYRFYQKFYKHAWILSVILLVAVKLIGTEVNGAKRWISITKTLSFQPSEVVKFLMIIFYAAILVKNRDELKLYGKGFIKHFLYLVPIIGLLILEPHLSASMVIIGIVSIMMIVAGCKFKHFLLTGLGFGVPLLGAAIAFSPYRLERFVSFLDPWKDATDSGWQVIQSLYAIGPGGLFGLGLGNSIQKHFYLPEPQTDFIFAIISEELGFVGILIITACYIALFYNVVKISLETKDLFGKYLAFGLILELILQTLLNLLVVVGLIPVTGVTLPFLSYGGSSLLTCLIMIGIILNISKNK